MAVDIKLPEVGEGVASGTVVGILVAVGDTVETNQPILELETDKAVVEVPASSAGVVESIKVAEGDEIEIGALIMTVAEGSGKSSAAEAPVAKEEPQEETQKKEEKEVAKEVKEEAKTPTQSTSTSSTDSSEPVPAAPSVRRLARELNVNIHDIVGSGILGRISAEDVKRYAETGSVGSSAAQPAALAAVEVDLPDFSSYGEVTRESMSGIRKATLKQMTLAWTTVPMVTHFDKANLTDFEKLRKQYQPYAAAQNAKITPTAILLKIAAVALKEFPKFNASIDVKNSEVVYKKYINIGVAVDTDNGLLVPVIRNVDSKGIVALAVELGEIAEKARNRKLSPDDMKGGNFNISNLGGIGGNNFTPIVNPPDVAILGVARGSIEPVWDKATKTFNPAMMLPLSLTYDHRLIDGADAARFLKFIREAVEDPFLMSVLG